MAQERWSGINDNLTDISDPMETVAYQIDNATFIIGGECGRRLGFGAVIAPTSGINSGLVAGELFSFVIMIGQNGAIVSFTEAQ